MDDLSVLKAALNMLHAHAMQGKKTLIQIEAIGGVYRKLDAALDRLAAAESQRPADSMECPMCGGAGYIVDITEAIEQAQASGLVLQPLRAALKEQPLGHSGKRSPAIPDLAEVESGASAVGRIARQGWHRPWCWQQWARSLADSEMGSACTCSAALKEQPHE